MKLRSFLFILALGSITVGAPPPALCSPDSNDTHAKAAHGDSHGESHGAHAQGLNWFDFSNKHAPPIAALLVNFVLLVFLVYILLRKGLTTRFKNRKKDLEAEIEAARAMKEKAESALNEARAKMEALDAEMARIKQNVLDAGKAQSAKIYDDAKAAGERLSSDALIMVEQEVARLTQEIRAEIVEEVIELARKLVSEKISQSDHDRIFGEYLAGIGANPSKADPSRTDGEAR